MVKVNVKVYGLIRNCIVCFTILSGFLYWLSLPSEVAVHFNSTMSPDRYGNKLEMLIILILPVFALMPLKLPKFQLDTEEAREQIEKKRKLNALIQLILSIVLSGIVWVILVKA